MWEEDAEEERGHTSHSAFQYQQTEKVIEIHPQKSLFSSDDFKKQNIIHVAILRCFLKILNGPELKVNHVKEIRECKNKKKIKKTLRSNPQLSSSVMSVSDSAASDLALSAFPFSPW